jgi:uncharacterized membrane protein YeaQ/YmgE (transglycosylase-associated protein family)
MSSVISVIITAFVTGALARFAVPGPDPMPAWLTILIGLVGTLIGAGVVYAIAGADPAWMGIAGFLCAIVLVLVYRRFVQKRAIWGPEAYRFPQRGVGVDSYRERLQRAGIDPDTIGAEIAAALTPRGAPAGAGAGPGAGAPAQTGADDPTENPAHYLRLLDELHDNGVLETDEYQTARTRLLERLRA